MPPLEFCYWFHPFYLPWVRLIPSFGSFGHVFQKVHGFIRIFAKKVPSTHGLQELFHGRGHPIVEMVHQNPCVKAMMRACTDGLKIPFPALIKSLTVMSCKGIDFPLQVVGLMSTEELFQELCLQLSPVPDDPWP